MTDNLPFHLLALINEFQLQVLFWLNHGLLQNAMEFVFGSTFVCRTTDAAKEVSLYHAFSIICGVAADSYNFDSTWNMHCVDDIHCLSYISSKLIRNFSCAFGL